MFANCNNKNLFFYNISLLLLIRMFFSSYGKKVFRKEKPAIQSV